MGAPLDFSLCDGTIHLRRWTHQDVGALLAGFGDPSVTRWFPVAVPFTAEAARRFIDTAEMRWASGDQAAFAVVDQWTGSPVGGVDVDDIDWQTGSGDIGYWLSRPARGRGFATRAVRLATRWAFQSGLHRLTLRTEPGNIASLAVARRAGFQPETLLRGYDTDWRDGRRRDFILFTLARDPALDHPAGRGS